MKYEIDTHLFSQKLSSILIEKGMIDKKGNPYKIALYNKGDNSFKIFTRKAKTFNEKIYNYFDFLDDFDFINPQKENNFDVSNLKKENNFDVSNFQNENDLVVL